MLVRRRVARRGGMRGRVHDAQLRPRSFRALEEERVEFIVREEERVGAGGVGVEVDDVPAGEVACEKEVEDVCGWNCMRRACGWVGRCADGV